MLLLCFADGIHFVLTKWTCFATMVGNEIFIQKGLENMSENNEEILKDSATEKDATAENNSTAEYEVVSIPISDGTERDFAIMDTFEVEGQNYMAVSLIEEDEIQEGVYIYRYQNAEDGDVIVEKITAPAEYKKVSKFYECM